MKLDAKFWGSIFGALALGVGGGTLTNAGTEPNVDFACREKVAVLQERISASEKKSDMILDILKEIKQDLKDLKR